MTTQDSATLRFEIFPNAENLSLIQATPTLIHSLGDEYLSSTLLGPESHLRVLAFGGEACPDLNTLKRWKHDENRTELYNLYGITEVSCWATVHRITRHELDQG